jgi:hypothetical protein
MSDEVECRCPTCRAAFRGDPVCPRCGAELRDLMRVIAKAYALRRQARESLERGDRSTALILARQALRLHRTRLGVELERRVKSTEHA